MTTKTKLIEEVRLGVITAAIWENNTEHGIRHSVTFRRFHREFSEWNQPDNFRRDELLIVAKVADFAHSYLAEIIRRADKAPWME